MTTRSDIWTYNPDQMERDELLATLVGRDDMIQRLLDQLRTAMEEPQTWRHILVYGRRGTGKTTLLRALQYHLEDDEELSRRVIPIAFSEEENSITSVHGFLCRVVALCVLVLLPVSWHFRDHARFPSR